LAHQIRGDVLNEWQRAHRWPSELMNRRFTEQNAMFCSVVAGKYLDVFFCRKSRDACMPGGGDPKVPKK
jgi:hypothetical protein